MVINDLVYHCTDWEHEDQREVAICPKTHSFIIQCHSQITGVPETRIYHRGGGEGEETRMYRDQDRGEMWNLSDA